MGKSEKGVARKQRSYNVEFKEVAVSRILRGENVVKLSGELDVRRSVLYRWRDTYRAEGRVGLERRQGRPRAGQEAVSLESLDPAGERIAELELLVGQQAAELDFFERAFNALKPAMPNRDARTASGSIRSSTKSVLKADSASSAPAQWENSVGQGITGN